MVSLCPETAKSLAAEILRADIFVAIKKVCPFCVKLLDTLQRMELAGNAHVISESHPLFADVRKAVQEAYLFKTVPVVFVRGRFVGGNSDFMEIKHKIKDLMEMPKLDPELLFSDAGRIQ